MNMSGSGDIDYSDFRSQMVVAQNELEPTGQGARSTAKFSFEPMEGRGGLANNEVAELTYLETMAYIEVDDELGDQNVGTATELRGVVGANLPATSEAFPGRSAITGVTETIETENGNDLSQSFTTSDDAYFQMFGTVGGVPSDDETNGPGSNAASSPFYAVKTYRDLTGRGPVLDQNDDLDILSRIIVGDSVVNVSGNVRCHALWDIAETDDSGRRFSVPK